MRSPRTGRRDGCDEAVHLYPRSGLLVYRTGCDGAVLDTRFWSRGSKEPGGPALVPHEFEPWWCRNVVSARSRLARTVGTTATICTYGRVTAFGCQKRKTPTHKSGFKGTARLAMRSARRSPRITAALRSLLNHILHDFLLHGSCFARSLLNHILHEFRLHGSERVLGGESMRNREAEA